MTSPCSDNIFVQLWTDYVIPKAWADVSEQRFLKKISLTLTTSSNNENYLTNY